MWFYGENIQSAISFPLGTCFFLHYSSYITRRQTRSSAFDSAMTFQFSSLLPQQRRPWSLNLPSQTSAVGTEPPLGSEFMGGGTTGNPSGSRRRNYHSSRFYLQSIVFPVDVSRFAFSSCLTFQGRAPSDLTSFSSSHVVKKRAATWALQTLACGPQQWAGMDCPGNRVGLAAFVLWWNEWREFNHTGLPIFTFTVLI